MDRFRSTVATCEWRVRSRGSIRMGLDVVNRGSGSGRRAKQSPVGRNTSDEGEAPEPELPHGHISGYAT